MNNDSEREAFEAWLGRESFTERSDSGKYVSAHVDAMWTAWLGRAAAPQPVVPQGWKLLKDSTQDERSWPDDAAHENGAYFNNCSDCGRTFVGLKRRVVCRACSASTSPAVPAAQPQQEALAEHEIGALAYRGNTVSYMYDRAKVYGDEIMRCWYVLKDAGKHPGRTNVTLSDALRRALGIGAGQEGESHD